MIIDYYSIFSLLVTEKFFGTERFLCFFSSIRVDSFPWKMCQDFWKDLWEFLDNFEVNFVEFLESVRDFIVILNSLYSKFIEFVLVKRKFRPWSVKFHTIKLNLIICAEQFHQIPKSFVLKVIRISFLYHLHNLTERFSWIWESIELFIHEIS